MNSPQPLINPNVIQIHPAGGHKLKSVLKIIPEKYIVFQCEDEEPMGEIRINLLQPKQFRESKELLVNFESSSAFPDLNFELTCTHRQNYKVSNSRGKLEVGGTQLIRIYIKNIDNLEKCLSDKFRLRITGRFTSSGSESKVRSEESNSHIKHSDVDVHNSIDRGILESQTGDIFSSDQREVDVIEPIKLKILIQKQKPIPKFQEITNLTTQTISRTGSLYTQNPSLLSSTVVSDIRSLAHLSRINGSTYPLTNNSSISMNSHPGLYNQPVLSHTIKLQQKKIEFDKSSEKLKLKERELKLAQSEVAKNEAKTKLLLIWALVVFLMAFALGFLCAKIYNNDIWDEWKTQANDRINRLPRPSGYRGL